MLNGSMIPRSVRRMFDERAEPREEASSSAELELRGILAELAESAALDPEDVCAPAPDDWRPGW